MTKEQVKAITDIRTVQGLYSCYRGVLDWWEYLYGGPHGATAFPEYYALCGTATNLYNRYCELLNQNVENIE